MTTRRALIIANPTAGSGAGRINKARLLEVARRELERGALQVEIAIATDAGDVSDLAENAARAGIHIVIAAGGDGTINAVANGLMRVSPTPIAPTPAVLPAPFVERRANRRKTDQPESEQRAATRAATREQQANRLQAEESQFNHGQTDETTDNLSRPTLGILPMGTGNVFAFNLGIASSLREACRVIRQGHARRIDVGLARSLGIGVPATGKSVTSPFSQAWVPPPPERHFLLMAGVGFDAKVMEDTSLRLKYVLRDFAYVLSTLQNVVIHKGTRTLLQFEEGGRHDEEAWLLMVGNAASYAWDIKFTSQAQLDDGVLDVCLLPWENKLVSIQQAIQVLTGQHIERGTARYWKTKGLRIECDPPVPVQLDGDEWSRTPLEITVLPGALRVLAPPRDATNENETK